MNNPPAQFDEGQEREHEKALSTLILSIEDDQLIHIQGLTTAKAVWHRLRNIYIRETAGTKTSLTRRIYKCKMQPGESVSKHLQVMKGLFNELELMNVHFTEQHKVFVILSSLPSQFDVLIMSLESLPDAQLSLEYVTSRLLQEQQRWDERSDSVKRSNMKADQESWRRGLDGSVKGRTPATDREQHGRAMTIKYCYGCGSKSHLLRDCKQAGSKKQGETFSKSREQAAYGHSGEGSRKRISLVKKTRDKVSKVVCTAAWIIDSGAVNHLTNESDVFSFLGDSEQHSVTLVN